MDCSPPGSSFYGILQTRTLEWVAISFSNAWKWKVKGKSLSRVRLLVTPWTAAYQAPPPMGLSRQEDWSGGHCFLRSVTVGVVWIHPPSPSDLEIRSRYLNICASEQVCFKPLLSTISTFHIDGYRNLYLRSSLPCKPLMRTRIWQKWSWPRRKT